VRASRVTVVVVRAVCVHCRTVAGQCGRHVGQRLYAAEMETAGGPDENAQDEDEKTSPPSAVRQVDGRRVVVVVVVGGGGSDGPDRRAQIVAVQEPVQVSPAPNPDVTVTVCACSPVRAVSPECTYLT